MADKSPKPDVTAQDVSEEQASEEHAAVRSAPATAVIGEEQEIPPAARELHCSLGFDTPTGFMPHTVGARFTQTVDNESVEFEIVEANRNDDTRRVEIVAREVKQESTIRRRSR